VQFESGSKAKSLHYLLNNIDAGNYDIGLVLDGDNIMLPGFLEEINAAFQKGYAAVQGHRMAKNKNTAIAILDAISEEINNHLFRKAQRVLGFSAAVIGSGMAFEFKKLKEVYNKPGITDNPACDREVDFEMMKAGIVVEYIAGAGLLDEKVAREKVFRNQRRRWLESQVSHLQLFFSRKEHVPHKTKDYWNKLFINLLPPRIIFLSIFFLIFLICLLQLWLPVTGIVFIYWLGLFILYVICLLLSIPARFYNMRTLKALFHLPFIVWSFLRAAMGMRLHRHHFVHTPKSYTGEANTGK
jgi:cellulose synthase/poly-beta-1,6-N-acetylglucosamine synthase-like glycosyltransferase